MEAQGIKPESLVKKAKRRIRKFIETGEHQPRTYAAGENRFEYKVKHSEPASYLYFALKNNRLCQEKDNGDHKL